MRSMRYFLLLLFLMIYPLAGKTLNHTADCERLYALFGKGKVSANYRVAEAAIGSTVEVGTSMPGRFGGQRVRLVRVGDGWLSSHAPDLADIQGDPRWFLFAFGEKTSRFFGFEAVSSTEIIVPDALEFTGAIRAINKQLALNGKQPIPMHFYESGGVDSDYLRKILENGLPYARAGNPMVHDVSFHLASILLPPTFWNALKKRIEIHLEFTDYLQKKYHAYPEMKKLIEEFSNCMKEILGSQLDYSTGQQSLLFLNPKNFVIDSDHASFQGILENALMHIGPKEDLYYHTLYAVNYPPFKAVSENNVRDALFFTREIREFIATHSSLVELDLPVITSFSAEDVERLHQARFDDIQEAVRSLLNTR